jgi:hypothetical protein
MYAIFSQGLRIGLKLSYLKSLFNKTERPTNPKLGFGWSLIDFGHIQQNPTIGLIRLDNFYWNKNL